MDHSNLLYASAYSLSPSIRSSTSRYFQRLTISPGFADQSSLNSTYATVESSRKNVDINVSQSEVDPCTVLFKQFLEARRKHGNREDVFDLLQAYEEICADHLTVILSLLSRKNGSDAKKELIRPLTEQRLKCERNTWRLIRAIYFDRLTKSDVTDEAMAVDGNRKSDKQVIELLYEKDSKLRELQLIIDCLEQNESDDIEEETNFKLEFYSEGPHYWENTLHCIKKQQSMRQQAISDRSPCSEMDPDAYVRTGKPLHDLDKEDEDRLMRYLFRYLRAGRLIEAGATAQRMGYHWLAAVLHGWILHHDPNIESRAADVNLIEGNANRDLWKFACWASATAVSDSQSIYEKAIFGALSGNLKVFLPLCNRWVDKLWAYCRVSVDVQIEHELRQTESMKPITARNSGMINAPSRVSTNLPDEYWNNLRSAEEILRELDADTWRGISEDEKCYYQIQKYAILNNIAAILETISEFIQNQLYDNASYWQMLRFFAHIVLFFKNCELIQTESGRQIYITVLQSYISYLIDAREIELVAEYVACLPHSHQVDSYAQLLRQVKEPNQRKLCLKLAKQANLDVDSITKTVVETVRSDSSRTPELCQNYSVEPTWFTELSAQTTEEDKIKIDALDWLSLNGIQYTELLLQGNGLMRYFELRGKIDAAAETFRRLPVDLVDGVLKSWKQTTGRSELPAPISNATKEYLCHKAYFQACDSFDEWLRFYCNSKPQEPAKPASSKFSDKVAYEHIRRQYEVELEQWKMLLAKQAQLTSEKIYNVLLFPDGVWLPQEANQENESEDVVKEELKLLRKKVIPLLTFVLHSLLHSSNQLKDCLQIADVVASEQHRLYEEFSQEQVKCLLRNLRLTAIATLNDSLDPLGYPTTSN